MSNYDYRSAKLVMIHTTQFEDVLLTGSDNTNEGLKKLVNSSADGFILIPDSENFNLGKIVEETLHYGADGASPTMGELGNSLRVEVERIYKINSRKKIWLGLPSISSNNFPIASDGEYGAKHCCDVLVHFIELMKRALTVNDPEQNLWKNIAGFYYNQESIYINKFDTSNLLNNPEFELMQNISECIHGSTYSKLKYSGKTHIPVEIKKDLIWMPYLVAYSKDQNNTAYLIKESYKRIAYIVEKSNVFDAAMIQANLIGVYTALSDNGSKDPKVNYTDEKYYADNPDMFNNIIQQGIKNIDAISRAMREGEFFYSDTEEPVVPNKLSNITCQIGGIYELIGAREFYSNKNADNTTHYGFRLGDKSLFKPYRAYDEYVDYHPFAFYWEVSETENAFENVLAQIEQCYNVNERFSPKDLSIRNTDNSYYDTLSYSIFKTYVEIMKDTLSDYTKTSVTLDLSKYKLPAYEADIIADTLKEIFLADNPNLFWIKDITSNVECDNEDCIKKITYTVTRRFENILNLITAFENAIDSILNGLGIHTTNNEILYMADNTNEDTFVSIYNWLVSNVTYNEDTQNVNYDCAYGAINPSIRKATAKGFSEALAVLCHCANIPCLVMKGYKNGSKHYWNFVKLNNNWWFVDASLSVPTSSDPYKYKYFLREMPASYMCSECYPVISQAKGSYINYGDVDNNGVIDSMDAAMVEQKALKPSYDLGLIGNIAADVDCDGNITKDDSNHILQKVLKSTYLMPIETKIKEEYI